MAWIDDWELATANRLTACRIANRIEYDGGMKAPSDIRMSVIAILIAVGIMLVMFCEGGWIVAPIPFGAGIGAMFPKPVRSALMGTALGATIAFFVFYLLS